MEYIYVGEVVNTHGIKGELRVISDFKYKEQVLKEGFIVFVGRFKDKLKIIRSRKHKNFDLITFEGLDNINDVIMYKGDQVYINSEDLKIDGFFNEQLTNLEVYFNDKSIGHIETVINNNAHDILVINDDKSIKKHLVPYLDEFIDKIDIKEKKVYIKNFEGLIDEN